MINFYSIIAFDQQGERDRFYQHKQLPDRLLSIGWGFEDPRNFQTEEGLFQMIWEGYDRQPDTEHNARNGARSLHTLKQVAIGDIIFVRGDARIVDIVRITGNIDFRPDLEHHALYLTCLPFEPLRSSEQIFYPVNEMTLNIRKEFVFEDGRPRVFKKLNLDLGITLLSNVISRY